MPTTTPTHATTAATGPAEVDAPLSARDARLAPWRAFVRAQAHVSRRLDEDLRAEHGLSLQEYVALLILAEAPERRLRMGRLADSLTLSKSGATRLIDRLVDDGLVDRVSCSSDLRGAEAALTEAGRQAPPNRGADAPPRHRRVLPRRRSSETTSRSSSGRCCRVADRACGTKDRA